MHTTLIHHTPWRVVHAGTDDELLEGTALTHQGSTVSFVGIDALPRSGRSGRVLLHDGRFTYAAAPADLNLTIERRDAAASKVAIEEAARGEGAASAAILARYIDGQHSRGDLAGHLAKAAEGSMISVEYLRRARGRAAAVTNAAFRLNAAAVAGDRGSVHIVAALAEQYGIWGSDPTIAAAVEHTDAALSWARSGARSPEYLDSVPAPIGALVASYWAIPGAELALPSSTELDDLQLQLDRAELESVVEAGTDLENLVDAQTAAAIARLGFATSPRAHHHPARPAEGRAYLAAVPSRDADLIR